jgi:two-component system, NarL family, invasion response regulator UvrY
VGLRNNKQPRLDDQANSIAVLIADPHPRTRSGLRIALKHSETVRVVGEAPDLASAISAVSSARVDVVLADSRLAEFASESARAGLAQLTRRVPVIVMGMGDPRDYAAPLQAAGAAGCWAKDGDLAQLTGLVVAAAHGHPGTAPGGGTKRRLVPI